MDPKQTSEIAEDLETMGKALQHHADTMRAPPPNEESYTQYARAKMAEACAGNTSYSNIMGHEFNRTAQDAKRDMEALALGNELCAWLGAAHELMGGSVCDVTPKGLKECWAARERRFASEIGTLRDQLKHAELSKASASDYEARINQLDYEKNCAVATGRRYLDEITKLKGEIRELQARNEQQRKELEAECARPRTNEHEYIKPLQALFAVLMDHKVISRAALVCPEHVEDASTWLDSRLSEAKQDLIERDRALIAEAKNERELRQVSSELRQVSGALADARKLLDDWQRITCRVLGTGKAWQPIQLEQAFEHKCARIAELTERLNEWYQATGNLDLGKISPERLRDVLLDYRRRVAQLTSELEGWHKAAQDLGCCPNDPVHLIAAIHSRDEELRAWKAVAYDLGVSTEPGTVRRVLSNQKSVTESLRGELKSALARADVSATTIENDLRELREWRNAAKQYYGYAETTVSPAEFVSIVNNRQSELREWRAMANRVLKVGAPCTPKELEKSIEVQNESVRFLSNELREARIRFEENDAHFILGEVRDVLKLSADEPLAPGMLRDWARAKEVALSRLDQRITSATSSFSTLQTEWLKERETRAKELELSKAKLRRATNEWSIATREFWAALRSPGFAITMADIFRAATTYGQDTETIVEGVVGALSRVDQTARANAAAQVRATE